MTDESVPKKKLSRGLLAALLKQEPIWSWHSKFHPSLQDHMHALGVAVANYNSLEFVFQALFEFYTSFEDLSAAHHLFSQLNTNQKRIEILSRPVSYKERKNPAVSDGIEHFLRGVDICAENRNLLMHGRIFEADTRTDLVLQKYARKDPTKVNYMHLTVQDIRRVADEFSDYEAYGAQMYLWLHARRTGGKLIFVEAGNVEPAWPKKPLPLDKLSLSDHPIRPVDPSQYQS
jgi:hypothetical protein